MYCVAKDGVKLFYVYHKKSSPTLVFVHGWLLNHTAWSAIIDFFLSLGYSVVAVDLRGHGKSGKPEHPDSYSMDVFADDIMCILKKEKIHNPILVGHSFGGMVILHYLQKHLRSARGVVLIDTVYQNPLKHIPVLKNIEITPFGRKLIDYLLHKEFIHGQHLCEVDFSAIERTNDSWWIDGMKQSPYSVALTCLREMFNFDEEQILSKISMPTLLLVGEHDIKTPPKSARIMHKKIKRSTLVVLKHVDHDSVLRHSYRVCREMMRFFAKHDLLP